jgi:hypothetical protein
MHHVKWFGNKCHLKRTYISSVSHALFQVDDVWCFSLISRKVLTPIRLLGAVLGAPCTCKAERRLRVENHFLSFPIQLKSRKCPTVDGAVKK